MKEEEENMFVNPAINYQFVGLGRRLADKKKRASEAKNQMQIIHRRVNHLKKEDQKTNKSIEHLKKHINQAINIRRRQQFQKKQVSLDYQKQIFNQQKQEQSRRLHQQAFRSRSTHKNNMQSTYNGLYDTLHSNYRQDKLFSIQNQRQRKNIGKQRRRQKRNLKWQVEIGKQKGKQRVWDYKRQQNMNHVYSYYEEIKNLQEKQEQNKEKIKQLQVAEKTHLNKLEESRNQRKKMAQSFKKAFEVPLPQLQQFIKVKKDMTVSASNRQKRKPSISLRQMKTSNPMKISRAQILDKIFRDKDIVFKRKRRRRRRRS